MTQIHYQLSFFFYYYFFLKTISLIHAGDEISTILTTLGGAVCRDVEHHRQCGDHLFPFGVCRCQSGLSGPGMGVCTEL